MLQSFFLVSITSEALQPSHKSVDKELNENLNDTTRKATRTAQKFCCS